jgi:8-amino-7-oxononanoate synthase
LNRDFLSEKLQKRKEQGILRSLSVTNPNLIDFSSNDYLGFAREPSLWEHADLSSYGSTGSRLLTGNYSLTEETEAQIASFHKAESGLIFNSGFDANTGLFSCIAGKDDTIIFDELIHASIRDGVLLSLAKHYTFHHNNLEDLEHKIRISHGRIFIAIESVYSMDGDFCPLKELAALTSKFENVYLIVDEAHATGVVGSKGQGLVQELGLEDAFFARVHTFGKALGCQGAIVLGQHDLRNFLVNYSRTFIYTTALPLPNIIAIKRAYELLEKSSDRINTLHQRIRFFREKVLELKIEGIKSSESAIQAIIFPGNENARKAAGELQIAGFDVRPILSPTVAKGTERLRICIHSFNTEEEITGLLNTIAKI